MRTTGSCIYLTVAFLRVYKTDTWFKAIVKALFTSLVYFIISLFIFIGIFLIAYLLTQYVSLGSVLSAGSFGFFYAFFHRDSLFPIIVSFFLSGLIVWMHRANIVRLIKGEERKTNLLAKGKKA